MSSESVLLIVRWLAGVAGLWWAILVLVRRIEGEIVRRRERLNDGAAIISAGRLARAAIALLMIGTLLSTTAIWSLWPQLYGAITPYVGLLYLILSVAWSGVEEATEQLLDRYNVAKIIADTSRAASDDAQEQA